MDILELVHGNDKPAKRYPCDEPGCGKSFSRNSDLARHARIHADERPYECNWPGCGKTFIQRSALTVHIRVHTGERPHVCLHPGCTKAFGDSSSLARHRRVHTGARPYQCHEDNCYKTFCRKITLVKHIKRHHPGSTAFTTPERSYSSNATNFTTVTPHFTSSPSAEPYYNDGDTRESSVSLSASAQHMIGLGVLVPTEYEYDYDCAEDCAPGPTIGTHRLLEVPSSFPRASSKVSEMSVYSAPGHMEGYRHVSTPPHTPERMPMLASFADSLTSSTENHNPYPTPNPSCASSPEEASPLMKRSYGGMGSKMPVYLPPLRLLHSNADAFDLIEDTRPRTLHQPTPITPALPTALRWEAGYTDQVLAGPRLPDTARFENFNQSYNNHINSYGNHVQPSASAHRFDFSTYSIQSPTWPFPSPSYQHHQSQYQQQQQIYPQHHYAPHHQHPLSPQSPRTISDRFKRSASMSREIRSPLYGNSSRRESYSQFINASAFGNGPL